MKKTLCMLMLVTSAIASEGQAAECRDAVVAGFAALDQSIERESFSTGSFDQFELSPEQYNALTPAEQVEIYQKIKPLPVMVQETIDLLNGNIGQVAGTIYEFFLIDELARWREARDGLRQCEMTE
ncbi:MAG: hypothetical protein CME65_00640 [Halobacteriovoraceae bacterium]|nr:hypothetical protein [Halobacteriovoraceae bacterium]|tara:strand:- start:12768 stop:13145 length:378 start_codon:yes stop_codon:yes gene_type:complete